MQTNTTPAEQTAQGRTDAALNAINDALDALHQVHALVSIARMGAAMLDQDDSCLASEALESAQVVERTLRRAEEQADRLLAALNAAESALLAH